MSLINKDISILYTHRRDPLNPGDLWACPKNYFFLNNPHDVCDVYDSNLDTNKLSPDIYITGGGAILDGVKWLNWNQIILDKINSSLNVVWGAGINFKNDDVIDYLTRFSLIGTRVFKKIYPDNRYSFVPCPSVMHNIFDLNLQNKYQVSIINHFKRPIKMDISMPDANLLLTNKPLSIRSLFAAIVQSETIITNSYHAAYWSMVMNKRVLCYIESLKCKLSTFEISPIYFNKDNFDVKMLSAKYDFSGLKERYRQLNHIFFTKILNEFSKKR